MLAQDLFLNFKGESLQSSRAAWIKFKKSTLGFKRIFFESVVQNLYISIYTPRFLSLFFWQRGRSSAFEQRRKDRLLNGWENKPTRKNRREKRLLTLPCRQRPGGTPFQVQGEKQDCIFFPQRIPLEDHYYSPTQSPSEGIASTVTTPDKSGLRVMLCKSVFHHCHPSLTHR